MRRSKIFPAILLGSLFFFSCSMGPTYNYARNYETIPNNVTYPFVVMPSVISLNIYWEWNEFIVSGLNLWTNGTLTQNEIIKAINQDNFCSTVFYHHSPNRVSLNSNEPIFIGENIRNYSVVSYDCLYSFHNLLRNEYNVSHSLEMYLFYMLRQRIQVFDLDSAYRVLYFGDSLDIKSNQVFNHRAVKTTLKFKEVGRADTILETRPAYEFYLSKSVPVYSISFKTNSEKLKGYKPLKIDPTLLPLESPKYKALKASEEKLRQ